MKKRLLAGLLVAVALASMAQLNRVSVNQIIGTLSAVKGGTGQAVYAIGDLLSADTTTTLSRVADVAVSQVLVSGGVGALPAYSASPRVTAIGLGAAAGASGVTFANATLINDSALGTLAMVSSAATNGVQIPNGSATEYGGCAWASNIFTCGVVTNGGTARHLRLLEPTGGVSILFDIANTDYWAINGASGSAPVGAFSAGSSSNPVVVTAPTDSTATDLGDLSRLRSSSTITPASGGAGNCGPAFLAALTTADCTIATLKAGQKLVGIYADVTAGFTCSGTCTGTKVVQCGTAVNGTQVLAASLSVATTNTQYGLVDTDLGSGMTRAAAIQGGLLPSWGSTTIVSCRFTSGTGAWGSGAATFVNAGSIKFTLITEQIK